MLNRMAWMLGLALLAGPSHPAEAQDSLKMQVVRFYLPETAQTLIKVFMDVPFSLLQPAAGGTGNMVYAVSAQVSDSTGLALLSEPMKWTTRLPGSARMPGASGLELMEFAVAPGRYSMRLTVTDSVSGRSETASTEVVGFANPPEASDLVLSPVMRRAGEGDTVPQPGQIRRGNTIIVPAVRLRLTPLRTTAYYLLEAYSKAGSETSGTMQVSILDSTGKTFFRTSPSSVPVPPGGGTLQGQLDLDGLPPGIYQFAVTLDLNGQHIERQAPFVMSTMQEAMARQPVQSAAGTDEDFFAAMDEAQLDSAEAPLMLIAKSSELSNYGKLSVSAKRRFLAEFWRARDAQPDRPGNAERDRFYQAIAYADRTFRVGRGTQEPGWRTDRGRIYAKYGAASDQLTRVQNGGAPSYEVWRYTRGRQRYYVFADVNGFGAYKLIFTNDVTETGVPNWREILTERAVVDVGQYLGINIDLYPGSGNSF